MGLGLLILVLCIASMLVPIGTGIVGYRIGRAITKAPQREPSEVEKINNMVAVRLSMGDPPDSPVVRSLLRQAEARAVPERERAAWLERTQPKGLTAEDHEAHRVFLRDSDRQ